MPDADAKGEARAEDLKRKKACDPHKRAFRIDYGVPSTPGSILNACDGSSFPFTTGR
jgi:hypothetical protein